MKIRFTLLSSVAALALAGCGQKDAAPAASSPAAAAPAPAAPREIDITAGDTMKYDVTSITASPGEDLKVVLTNSSGNPITVMGHNWVLLKAGSDAAAFATAAGAAGPSAAATGYIPDSLKDEIVAKIDLLGPHKSGEVDFKAPTAPGDYPFLCTYPAHYLVGMHGILTVK
jgi:azurin